MSETLSNSDEDDQQAGRGTQPPQEDETRHPSDQTIEEMLRRALAADMDDTPRPDEPLINMRFDE